MSTQTPNRDACLTVVVGMTGTGKTSFLKVMTENLVNNGRKVLIITPNPEAWYDGDKFPFISPKKMFDFERCGVLIYNNKEIINNLLELKDTVLILDDFKGYNLKSKENETLISYLIRSRMKGCDTFMVAHHPNHIVPTAIWFYVKNVISFRVSGKLDKRIVSEEVYVKLFPKIEQLNKIPKVKGQRIQAHKIIEIVK